MEDLKRILIVDDSPTVIEHVKLLLKDYNVKLNTAGSSFGMYQNIESYGKIADLILMDLTLKKEHGLDLIEDLRSNDKYKEIPVIIVTEYVTKEFIMRAKKLSVSHYIKKPIKKDLLIGRIKELIPIYDLNELAERISKENDKSPTSEEINQETSENIAEVNTTESPENLIADTDIVIDEINSMLEDDKDNDDEDENKTN